VARYHETGAFACGGSVITATLRKRDLTPAQIVAITCAVAAATQAASTACERGLVDDIPSKSTNPSAAR
jgi:hypothetical protein